MPGPTHLWAKRVSTPNVLADAPAADQGGPETSGASAVAAPVPEARNEQPGVDRGDAYRDIPDGAAGGGDMVLDESARSPILDMVRGIFGSGSAAEPPMQQQQAEEGKALSPLASPPGAPASPKAAATAVPGVMGTPLAPSSDKGGAATWTPQAAVNGNGRVHPADPSSRVRFDKAGVGKTPDTAATSGSVIPSLANLEESFRELNSRDKRGKSFLGLSLGDLQLYQQACGHEGKLVPMLIERLYSALGVLVVRHPGKTILFSLLLVAVLSSGLLFAQFTTNPELLYIPQFSELGLQRKYVDSTFGARPQPGIFVIKHQEEGGNIITRDHMLDLFKFHELVSTFQVQWQGEALSFRDMCARRFFAQAGEYECLSDSLLKKWFFQLSRFEEDEDWMGTVLEAYDNNEVNFGAMSVVYNGTERQLRAEAVQASYYFNSSLSFYADGGINTWEEALVREVEHINDQSGLIALSYWSTKLNEKDASAIVTKDVDVLCLTFIFILLYVCITLGGFTLDRRRSRMALGAFCGICTVCSLASGFGLCAYLGVPLAPMSTLVLFTLIGVSVDDMIIIVDAFDRTSPQVSLEERLRVALSHAGTAVTMTSMTTITAFLSGVAVDLPSIQLFCAPAAASVLMVNVLQVTLFTALLVQDAQRQSAHKLDCACLPSSWCVPAHTERTPSSLRRVSSLEGAKRAVAAHTASFARPPHNGHALASPPATVASLSSRARVEEVEEVTSPEDEVGCTNSPIGIWWRDNYAEWLMRTPVRVAVMVVFACLVATASLLLPHIQLGLPVEDTLPDDSTALKFFHDMNRFWTGAQDFQVMLVLRDTKLDDYRSRARAVAALAEIEELDFVLGTMTNWMDDFRQWANCTAVERTGKPIESADEVDWLEVPAWLEDPEIHFCVFAGEDAGADGDATGGKGKRRRLLDAADAAELVALREDLVERRRGDLSAALGFGRRGHKGGEARLLPGAPEGAVMGGVGGAAGAGGGRRDGERRRLDQLKENWLEYQKRQRHERLVAMKEQRAVWRQADPEEEVVPVAPEPTGSPEQAASPSSHGSSKHHKGSKGHKDDKGDTECTDLSQNFYKLSSGHTCEEAKPNCAEGMRGWHVVRKLCAATCGLCDGPNAPRLGAAAADGELVPEDQWAYGGLGASPDVIMEPGDRAMVRASRFFLTISMPKVIIDSYFQYEEMREILAKHDVDGFVYHYRYEFGVCDHMMPRLCLRNLLVAAVGIFLTVWIFLPFRLAILSTLTVAMIDLLLLGVMVLWGVRLHCMTTVTLLIALGLAIDYSCHLAHAYETSPLPTMLDKVSNSVARPSCLPPALACPVTHAFARCPAALPGGEFPAPLLRLARMPTRTLSLCVARSTRPWPAPASPASGAR